MTALTVLPLVLILLSLPLVFGKIPPNWFYGFRTPKTLPSREAWYKANRRSGVYLVIAALVMQVGALVLRAAGVAERSTLSLVMMLVPLAVAIVASLLHLRRL